MGYATEVFLPTLLLHSMGLLRSLLHSLGLLQPDPAHSGHHPPLPVAFLLRERLPVTLFSDSPGAAERCAVCLSEFEGGEEVRRPLNCRHIFHRGCLDRWMDHDHRTCPLCRAHLLTPDLVDDFHRRLLSDDNHPRLLYYPDYVQDFNEHDPIQDPDQHHHHPRPSNF